MEQRYEWAVKITMELLDGAGGIEDTETKIRKMRNEQQARLHHEGIIDTIARYRNGGMHPKYQRLGGAELLRRPVGEWESMDEAVQA